LRFGELELHQDADEKRAASRWLLAAAAEGSQREGDDRLAGRCVEEARTRAVPENLSDTASMRVPRCSNMSQQLVASPQPLP